MTLHEVSAAADIIYEAVDPNANIIFGAVIDDRLQGEIRITVIATGFTGEAQSAIPAARVQKTTARPFSTPVPRPEPTPVQKEKPPELDSPECLQKRRPPR